jgi:hypothetical protein
MTSLDLDQKEGIKRWLRERGALRCRVCDLSNLIEPNEIITLPGAENKPLVPLTCGHCANVVLFDAKMVGVT